jgi:hypothetical protein
MKLITDAGKVQFGIHQEPIDEINHTDWTLKSPLGQIITPLERDKLFKRFHFMGFISRSLVVGCAMTDTSRSKTAFVYLYDKANNRTIKHGFRARPDNKFAIASAPDEGISKLITDKAKIIMTAASQASTKRLQIDVGEDLSIDMTFTDAPSSFDTLRICTPTGPTGWTYAQKVAGCPAIGKVVSEFGHIDLMDDLACAHHDYTAGFLRPETFWNWACISDRTKDGGTIIGANLSNGVNETGFTENAYWINGTRHKVDTLMFDYDDEDLRKPWHITSYDGAVDLTFKAEDGYGAYSEKPGAETRFDQLFGQFKGRLGTGTAACNVEDLWGFSERQYVVW